MIKIDLLIIKESNEPYSINMILKSLEDTGLGNKFLVIPNF